MRPRRGVGDTSGPAVRRRRPVPARIRSVYRAAVREPTVVEVWGSTVDERAASYPCDGLLDGADRVLHRAVDVEAPADLVFRWLCQLRTAPYSYDWVDNLGRLSPRRLTPGLAELEIGQRVMTIFRLVGFEPGRSITLHSETGVFGRVVISYVVVPTAEDKSRLVVKLAFTAPPGVYGSVLRKLLPAGDLLMMRKQLLTLKALAERDARAQSATPTGPSEPGGEVEPKPPGVSRGENVRRGCPRRAPS